jgi:hypothetical protein
MRAELLRTGITQDLVHRHRHLISPMHVTPACGADRVVFAAGLWDQLVLVSDITALHRAWPGSAMLTVEQGHFGFRMAEACYQHLETHHFLNPTV